MIDERYYNGYEGEPEITFVMESNNGQKEEFGMWDGYFNSIMKEIKPSDNGWTGLAYYYHLYTGWYDESPWLIANPKEVYAQLKEIDKRHLKNEEIEILKVILNMLQNAIYNGYNLSIVYD